MECPQRHRNLFVKFCPPPFSRMEQGGRFPQAMAERAGKIPRNTGDWPVLGINGRRCNQSPACRRKKTGANPTDRGKQGVKRSLLTDAAGIPLSVAVDGANRHDAGLVEETLKSLQIEKPLLEAGEGHGLCMDKGYDSRKVRAFVKAMGYTAHIRSRGEEKKELEKGEGFKARRWVVERTYGWLNRFRQILVQWEKLPENYLAMLYLACGIIVWRST